jgi:hypothetical protein
MMPCFKLAWDKGFTMERNKKGWQLERLIPFNRNALWSKQGDLLRTSTVHNVVPTTITPSSKTNPAGSSVPPASATPTAPPVAANPAVIAPKYSPIVAPPAGVAFNPSPKDDDLPPLLGHVTERVQKAMDYIKNKHA